MEQNIRKRNMKKLKIKYEEINKINVFRKMYLYTKDIYTKDNTIYAPI
jgi:hypothetical protein